MRNKNYSYRSSIEKYPNKIFQSPYLKRLWTHQELEFLDFYIVLLQLLFFVFGLPKD